MQHETITGLVSIGLPAYNRPESLRRVLKNITSQTYKNLEIIVSDDASPDYKIKSLVEEFAIQDPRITYYRQEKNLGVLANAEFVLKKSHGEYFTWFSDDDWRSPEFIDILVAELEKNKDMNFAFCDYREVYEDGSQAGGYPTSHLNLFKPFGNKSRLVRVLSYYWQNAVLGKPNLFYSVFRKSALAVLDIKNITDSYKHLNMDCLISFSLLQKSAVSISSEVMCTLTCGNRKFYSFDEGSDGGRKKSLLSKLIDFILEQKKDRDLYIKNTNRAIEKISIYFLFLPKLVALLISIGLRKFARSARLKKSENKSTHETEALNNFNSEESHTGKRKIQLPNVTLVAMATRNVEETLKALVYSCQEVDFGRVKLLSHYTPYGLGGNIEFTRIEKIQSIDDWSYKIVYELSQYIDTDFALLVHADGFVVNPSSWKDDFLNYDYIGAPWPLPTDDFSYRDFHGEIIRVGNSVSLRSKRLLDLPIKLNLPWEPYCGFYNEDGFICAKNKHIYEAEGMKFAPLEVAKYFSHEAMIPEVQNIKPFVFHKWAGSNSIYPKF
jgi:glycosyltransferase involved in cell wall biosynthesis